MANSWNENATVRPSETPTRISQVAEYMGLLEKDLEEVVALVERLDVKLSPVLNNFDHLKAVSAESKQEQLAPLASALRERHCRAKHAIDELHRLLEQIEL